MDGNLALTLAAVEIVWLDLMLAGDGATDLAVATRVLPQSRRLAVNLGGVLLMLSRAAFLLAALACAPLPGYGLFCAAALVFAAWLSARRGEAPPSGVTRSRGLPALLLAVVARDAPAAFVNMLAAQAAAQGQRPLAALGFALALPMIALGAAPFVGLLRKPPLIWAGAALLGWLAGLSASADALLAVSPMPAELLGDVAPPLGATLSLLIVFLYLRRHNFKRLPEEEP